MTAPSVVLASGHMVVLPDRPTPRFPADQVPRVTAEVRAALEGWQVGAETTVVCGGARGADLIVAEEGHARGARIVLCLALPPESFERRSVEIPGIDWVARFRRIAEAAEIRVLGDAELAHPLALGRLAEAPCRDRAPGPRRHTRPRFPSVLGPSWRSPGRLAN